MNTEFFFFTEFSAASGDVTPTEPAPPDWLDQTFCCCLSFFFSFFFECVWVFFCVFFSLDAFLFLFVFNAALYRVLTFVPQPPHPLSVSQLFFVIFSRFFFNRALPSFFTEFYFSRLVRDSGRISPINLLLRQYWLKLVYLDWLWYHQDSVSIRGLSHLPSFFFYRVLFFSSSAWLWTNFTSQLIHMKILIQIGLLNFTLKPVPVSIRGLSHLPSFYLYCWVFLSVVWLERVQKRIFIHFNDVRLFRHRRNGVYLVLLAAILKKKVWFNNRERKMSSLKRNQLETDVFTRHFPQGGRCHFSASPWQRVEPQSR